MIRYTRLNQSRSPFLFVSFSPWVHIVPGPFFVVHILFLDLGPDNLVNCQQFCLTAMVTHLFWLWCRGWWGNPGCLIRHGWQAYRPSSFCPWKAPGRLWWYVLLFVHTSVTAMFSTNSRSVLTPFLIFIKTNADTVDAYESGKLAKLLNIAVKDDLWMLV